MIAKIIQISISFYINHKNTWEKSSFLNHIFSFIILNRIGKNEWVRHQFAFIERHFIITLYFFYLASTCFSCIFNEKSKYRFTHYLSQMKQKWEHAEITTNNNNAAFIEKQKCYFKFRLKYQALLSVAAYCYCMLSISSK